MYRQMDWMNGSTRPAGEGDPRHWDMYLDTCVYACNTSRHESTKFTLMFGRKAVEIDMEKKDGDDQIEPLSTELSSSALEAITNRRQQLLGEAHT